MTPEELREAAEAARAKAGSFRHTVRVCTAAGCNSALANELRSSLEEASSEVEGGCRVIGVGCQGLCAAGPLVRVEPSGRLFGRVTAEDADRLVRSLDGGTLEDKALDPDQPFFSKQKRIVLRNCGTIDPDSLDDYLAAGGYAALATALAEMTPTEVIDEIAKSGLRGRGGAGYPTGLKWTTVAKAQGEPKYLICNADEGDPGAFMDRSVLEGDPHRVIEGMLLAAYAVGASQGYIYVRVEYPLAVERLNRAIKLARRAGLLGQYICGTKFSFQLELRLGAGAYVCGEETALMASIEGGRGTPQPRPPYPAESGLWDCPTLINNVETFANVPSIIENGGDWFADIGTDTSKGTKVFALAGRVRNTGLIEVPMGMRLGEIIEDIGGGVPDGRLKAVQTGGPSGGCIPASRLDTPVDYESLRALGSIMGSGGMIVMDESSSMVEVARYFMDFSRTESCGKCVPCRVGTVQLHELLERILHGRGNPHSVDELERLCEVLQTASLCGLGQSAPNPVLSTLRFFRDEYEALLRRAEVVHG
jgi:bidirectional [NiFe] hydrogenase diaphorase subunit